MGYYNDYLEHHGILGQKWGVRRFQRKDGTRTAAGKERQAENAKKKGLSDTQKKVLIGAGITVGVLLTAYGGYKLSQIRKSSKPDFGDYDAADFIKANSAGKADLSEKAMKMAVNKNPFGRKDNCKEVAHAFCESMYSNDPKVIAGQKPRFAGTLYDYVTEKLGWNEKHVMTAMGSNAEELRNTCTARINRKFADGDYGMIAFNANPERIKRLQAAGFIPADAKGIDGHCFNWIKENGVVKFFDCQPDGGPIDASKYFNGADFSKEAEIVCYNKAKSAQ